MLPHHSSAESSPTQELTAVKHARRECLLALFAWLIAMIYTVGYCTLHGYDRDIESLKFVWGMPDWIFWGIFVPWSISTIFSIWFAFRMMRDDDLGVERENALDELMELE